MSTLVVSDLHLGGRSGIDLVVRRPEVRDRLLEAARQAARLVLLGDLLELRNGPLAEALAAARPVLEALGRELGDRPVLLVPGNHDHRLIEGWRERRRADPAPAPLGPEQILEPAEASDAAGLLAQWLSPARLTIAYPGVWLRDDVYATHGHYLDRHVTVPALEPLAVRVVERLLAARGHGAEGVDGYEAVLAPVYAGAHELAHAAPARRARSAPTANLSARAYRALARDGGAGSRPLRHRLLGDVGLPALVAGLNAAGLGPLRAELSGRELRRSSLRAMGEVVDRLGIRAEHVVFGHTHRTGPLERDHLDEWEAPTGARLHNCGSWVVERIAGGPVPQRSPYRAGGALLLDDDEPPALRWLLDGEAD